MKFTPVVSFRSNWPFAFGIKHAVCFLLPLAMIMAMPKDGQTANLVMIEAKKISGHLVGDLINVDESLELGDQARMVLISAQGEKIEVKGPMRGSLRTVLANTIPEALKPENNMEETILANISSAVKKYRTETKRTRGIPPHEPLDPWYINTAIGGDQCTKRGSRPTLWRPSESDAEKIHLRANNKADETTVAFVSGEETHPWPMDLEYENKATYSLTDEKNGERRQITLHIIPDNLPTRAHYASELGRMQCSSQAYKLLVGSAIDKFVGEMVLEGDF